MSQSDAASAQSLTDPAGSVGIAEIIREHRRSTGITQEELAGRAGISVGAVRDLEQGRTNQPRPDSVLRLARGLGLDRARRRELLAALPPGHKPEGGAAANRSNGWARRAAGNTPSGKADRLEVLGPLTVWHNGIRLGLGPPRQRSVLGLLAISPGLTLHRGTIIDALWGDHPPATAVAMVQSYVSRLRRILPGGPGAACMIDTAGAGYRLQAAQGLDLYGFGQAERQGGLAHQAGDAAVACGRYEQALALWKGDPLADIDLLRGHPAVQSLRQRRAAMIVAYAGAACTLGEPGRALPFLLELAAAEPLHERVHAHLMIALASVGQQASALSVYEQLRMRLDRELGVRPSTDLVRAHEQVLRQELPTAAGARYPSRTELHGQGEPSGSARCRTANRALDRAARRGELTQPAARHLT
jgi:DNA-binding SARP family transcriptional activator/DNA-binding XRE family transcriptional regulator